MPIYLEIINPISSGDIITMWEDTRFEAVAYNPPYGYSNGDGIANIQFWFSGPGYIPGATESMVAYCAFTGNTPCTRMDERSGLDVGTLPNGTYTIYARATGVAQGRPG